LIVFEHSIARILTNPRTVLFHISKSSIIQFTGITRQGTATVPLHELNVV